MALTVADAIFPRGRGRLTGTTWPTGKFLNRLFPSNLPEAFRIWLYDIAHHPSLDTSTQIYYYSYSAKVFQGSNFCRSTQKPSFVDGNRCVDQFVSINFTVVDHVSRSVPKSVDQFLDHLVTWWKLLMMSAFTKRCFGETSLIFATRKKRQHNVDISESEKSWLHFTFKTSLNICQNKATLNICKNRSTLNICQKKEQL